MKRLADHAMVVAGISAGGQVFAMQPSRPTATVFGSSQTSATGANFILLAADVAAEEIVITNTTGTTLEFRKGGATFLLPPGLAHTFRALANAHDLEVRRADTSNTQVSVSWEAARY